MRLWARVMSAGWFDPGDVPLFGCMSDRESGLRLLREAGILHPSGRMARVQGRCERFVGWWLAVLRDGRAPGGEPLLCANDDDDVWNCPDAGDTACGPVGEPGLRMVSVHGEPRVCPGARDRA